MERSSHSPSKYKNTDTRCGHHTKRYTQVLIPSQTNYIQIKNVGFLIPQQRVDAEKLVGFMETLVCKVQETKIFGWYTFDLILNGDGEVCHFFSLCYS